MSEDATTNAPSTIEELKPGMAVKGTIKRLELYGAFVDIGIGRDALLHVSQLGKDQVRNIEDELSVGAEADLFVLKIDESAGRVALTTIKPPELPWESIEQGETYPGQVIRLEKFGAFVDIGAERPGMVHVSEMAEGYVKDPGDVVSEGQEVSVRVLKINRKKRQIDLSMREPEPTYDILEEEDEDMPTAMELAFRRAREETSADDLPKSMRDRRRKSADKRRRQQDDLISRTLKNHGNDV